MMNRLFIFLIDDEIQLVEVEHGEGIIHRQTLYLVSKSLTLMSTRVKRAKTKKPADGRFLVKQSR